LSSSGLLLPYTQPRRVRAKRETIIDEFRFWKFYEVDQTFATYQRRGLLEASREWFSGSWEAMTPQAGDSLGIEF
jgi:hypothetical protein